MKKSNDRELFDAFFPGLVNDVVKENEKDQENGGCCTPHARGKLVIAINFC